MNIAMLGYGSIAEAHARAIRALAATPEGRDLRLSGVMGPHREPTEAFARQVGAETATTRLDDLLDDPAVDAVIVCSPSGVHAEQTERALRAGKHVLCEIPLALSLAETDRLIALAEASGGSLMVCHTQRYAPALIEARRRIAAGDLHPHAIVSRYLFDRRENVNWMGRQRSWTDNLLWHHGAHAVDAALWLLGVADRGGEVETAAQVALPGLDLGIPMDLSLVMRTDRDQIATVVMSYHARIATHDYLIIGEETTLRFIDGRLEDPSGIVVDPGAAGDQDAAIRAQDAEFFAAAREGREPAISARSIRPAMAALQAAQDHLEARLRARGADARHPRFP